MKKYKNKKKRKKDVQENEQNKKMKLLNFIIKNIMENGDKLKNLLLEGINPNVHKDWEE